MKIKSKIILFLLSVLPAVILRIAIARMMYIEGHFIDTPMFIPSLLGLPLNINFYFTSYMGIFSILLLFLILQTNFNFRKSLLISFIYSLSPINAFCDVAGSPFSFYLFFILLISLSLTNIERAWAKYLYFLSTLIISISSLLFTLLIIPISLLLGNLLKVTIKPLIKQNLSILLFVAIVSLFSQSGLKTFFLKEVSIFDDPGIVNTVNSFRGDTQGTIFSLPSKLIENKYVYFGETIISNTLKHFSPAFIFTPKVKVFGFSFAPPVLTLFLIPFLMYLVKKLKNNLKIFKFVPLIFLLILPSVFSKLSPLVEVISLITPLLALTIYFGFEGIKNIFIKRLLIFGAGFQFIFVVLDMFIGEGVRLIK